MKGAGHPFSMHDQRIFRNLFVECKLSKDMLISTNSEIVLNYSLTSKQGKFNSHTVVFASYETIFN
jgi:hypothetical protein